MNNFFGLYIITYLGRRADSQQFVARRPVATAAAMASWSRTSAVRRRPVVAERRDDVRVDA